MKKGIYTLFLIVLVLLNGYSLFQITPKIIKERNQLNFFIITFKDKIDPTIQKKYGQKKYDKFFIKTNEKLKPKNQIYLVTKNKYTDSIKRNNSVSSLTRETYNKMDPTEFKNEAKLTTTQDWYDRDYKALIMFKLTSVLIIVNIFILIGIFVMRKIKK